MVGGVWCGQIDVGLTAVASVEQIGMGNTQAQLQCRSVVSRWALNVLVGGARGQDYTADRGGQHKTGDEIEEAGDGEHFRSFGSPAVARICGRAEVTG